MSFPEYLDNHKELRVEQKRKKKHMIALYLENKWMF